MSVVIAYILPGKHGDLENTERPKQIVTLLGEQTNLMTTACIQIF